MHRILKKLDSKPGCITFSFLPAPAGWLFPRHGLTPVASLNRPVGASSKNQPIIKRWYKG
jgi:hypothetical protein